MRVISKRVLHDFWEKHEDAEQPLKSWYLEAEKSKWTSPNQKKKEDAKASIIGDSRVVFNISGNKYRLIVKINYVRQGVFIRFVGTHKEYEKINAEKI